MIKASISSFDSFSTMKPCLAAMFFTSFRQNYSMGEGGNARRGGIILEVNVKGSSEEIAALVLGIQERQGHHEKKENGITAFLSEVPLAEPIQVQGLDSCVNNFQVQRSQASEELP